MDAYTGLYYHDGGSDQQATLLFLKDKLSIGLRDEFGNPRVVYWYYDQVLRENSRRGDQSTFHYPGYPKQSIEVRSREFSEKLEEILNRKEPTLVRKIFNSRNLPLWKVAVVLVGVLILVYVLLIPLLAVRLASKVPIAYESDLGHRLFGVLRSGFKVDEQRTILINDFFDELKISGPYQIHITVVDENVPNAFAMPGGNIVVYDKILEGMTSYEELAALLSHEYIHIRDRHSLKSLFRSMGTNIFFSMIIGNMGAIASTLINNAETLKSLSYSRKLEKEADLEGLKILSERKIDGGGFVGLFELLKREPNVAISEWINSHPNLEKRIEYIQKDENFNRNGVDENETLKGLFLRIKTAE